MKWFFDMDRPVMRGLTAAADLLILNLLTLLCSLPLFTVGPALTALADGCLHLVRDEGSSVSRTYFRVFRARFRRSLPFGLLLLLTAGLLYFDYLAALTYVPPMRYGIAALGVLLLAMAVAVFFLLASGVSGFGEVCRKAVLLVVGNAPKTALLLVVWLTLWVLALMFIRYSAPVLLMFGLSLPGYVSAAVLAAALPDGG